MSTTQLKYILSKLDFNSDVLPECPIWFDCVPALWKCSTCGEYWPWDKRSCWVGPCGGERDDGHRFNKYMLQISDGGGRRRTDGNGNDGGGGGGILWDSLTVYRNSGFKDWKSHCDKWLDEVFEKAVPWPSEC